MLIMPNRVPMKQLPELPIKIFAGEKLKSKKPKAQAPKIIDIKAPELLF